MYILLNSKPEPSSEGFELRKAESAPLVVPISKNGNVSEEDFFFLVKLRRIPSSSSGRIEELADDERIGISRLISGFPEQFENLLDEEFHASVGKCAPYRTYLSRENLGKK